MNSKKYSNFFEGRKVLITGGAGFIGSHLTQHLALLGANVHVLDDFSTGFLSNLDGMNTSIVDGTVLDTNILKQATSGCSIVFHQAAFVSVPESFENQNKCFEINIQGTKNVLSSAIENQCDRVIFASSAACYGSAPNLPSSEEDDTFGESPYAESKLVGETLMKEAHGIDTVSLRYFNVFGERQNPNSQYAAVVSAFLDSLSNERVPIVYGDGNQSRDFVCVENVVHANLLAASHKSQLRGNVFNVGTGSKLTILEMLQALSPNKKLAVKHLEKRIGDVRNSCANIEKIKNILGFEKIKSTEQALFELFNPKQR
jgi:nucleoside-diphosphate-sugar epimerase